MSIKIFQIHKPESDSFKEIQDCYEVSSDGNIIALSDGTTQGYKSEFWAENLVSKFIKKPTFEIDKFSDFIENVSIEYDKNSSSFKKNKNSNQSVDWLIQKKKDEGSSAAFIAIHLKNKLYEAISYGDSTIFIIKDGIIKSIFPKEAENIFINSDFTKFNSDYTKITEGNISKGDNILIVSDAISEFIQNHSNNIKKIISISSFDEFKDLIELSFENKNMEMDDITLINVKVDDSKEIKTYFPDDKFKYKKSLLPVPQKQAITTNLKGDKEMEKLIKMLKSSNDIFKNEIADYKVITSQLIKMNFAQWIIISIIILYYVVSTLDISLFNSQNKTSDVIKESIEVQDTTQIEKVPSSINDSIKTNFFHLEIHNDSKVIEKELENNNYKIMLESKDSI